MNPTSLSFGMVNHHDNMMQNGSLWMEQRSQRDFNSLANELNHSLDLSRSEFPAGTSGRLNHMLQDEFPHLDIINDLLDDEHGVGLGARTNTDYQMFPNHMSRQYSFPGDPNLSNGPGPSSSPCRFDRTRSYNDDSFQYGYGRSFDAIREMGPGSSSRASYVNGQVDGFMANQWQMGGSDQPLLRNMESDGYPYHLPEYQNQNQNQNLSVGINGYPMFRPSSNGH